MDTDEQENSPVDLKDILHALVDKVDTAVHEASHLHFSIDNLNNDGTAPSVSESPAGTETGTASPTLPENTSPGTAS